MTKLTGRHSKETREKISRTLREKGIGFTKGYTPWNKGKTGVNCGVKKGTKSPEHSEFMKEYYKTHKHPMTDYKYTREQLKVMAEYGFQKGQWVGEKNVKWKGGVTKKEDMIMKNKEGRMWRKIIFEKDNHECLKCRTNKRLETHHIKSRREYPELAFEISNGMTLCKSCHMSLEQDLRKLKDIPCYI